MKSHHDEAIGSTESRSTRTPGARALGLVWVIAAYSIAFGISFVALAFWLKNHGHAGA